MLSEAVDELLGSAPVPAIGVTVFTPEIVLYQAVHGIADLSTQRQVGPDDWWDLASLTKVLVTLPEVLSVVPDLDACLESLWPAAGDKPVGASTIRQLLTHTAGLPAYIEFFRTLSGATHIVAAALDTPLTRTPGTTAVYSDIGYLLLGQVVQDLTGTPLPDLARARSGLRFAPLPGPAVATEQCPWRGRLVVGEAHDENASAMGGVAGHAGAFGTLELTTQATRSWFNHSPFGA